MAHRRHGVFGIVQSGTDVLLVANRRRHGRIRWSLPGGRVDRGEMPLEALTREVMEETGLEVKNWCGPIYTTTTEYQGDGSGLVRFVEFFQAGDGDWEGELRFSDPDWPYGVVAGFFSDLLSVGSVFQSLPRHAREPIEEWLSNPWEEPRRFNYLVEGKGPDQTVERL